MADESDREPQAPKKPRRGAAKYRRNGLLLPILLKKFEEGFRCRLS